MSHDEYGKELLRRVLGRRFDTGEQRKISLADIVIELDGIIKGSEGQLVCAVEIEAENLPQVRSAMVNLCLHPAPLDLLVLMVCNLRRDPADIEKHLQIVWSTLTANQRGPLPIIWLLGDGGDPQWADDEWAVRNELGKLGVLPAQDKPQ